MTKAKKPLIFALSVLSIYAGGVLFTHLEYSAGDRQACGAAGGFLGRISCPDGVDTDGFKIHFTKALGWPADAARTMALKAGAFENAVVAHRDVAAQ